MKEKVRINNQIRSSELRVIGAAGENLGIISLAQALKAAQDAGLDLIEISPNATPPIAKVMDYGKYQYETAKKDKEIKAKAHVTETKNIQIKVGTSEHDQSLKAKQVAGWLKEGHRVKIDLFLKGRYKYMDFGFLKERLERFVLLIPEEYRVASQIEKGLKGLTITIEYAGKK